MRDSKRPNIMKLQLKKKSKNSMILNNQLAKLIQWIIKSSPILEMELYIRKHYHL